MTKRQNEMLNTIVIKIRNLKEQVKESDLKTDLDIAEATLSNYISMNNPENMWK